ncbi:MAG: poly-gamma-glutamate capsule biosynthesis protein CapA/YwtB (metallophosphatase superfamily) [Bacteriovoracaceae bacterium]|jgi:poly-gamma-glutamate capsule biosynthesis protein CapA/YwtB (metallophosphatase superfamily)
MVINIMISQQLKFSNILSKPWKQFLSPEDLNQVEESSIPRQYQAFKSSPNHKKVSVSFLGDITNIVTEDFKIEKSLQAELASSDYIIVNLELIIGPKKKYPWQKNVISKKFIQKFVQLFPKQKIIFGLANNHSFDLGEEGLVSTIKAIEEFGGDFVGTAKKPFIYLADGLRLDAQSLWLNSNQTQISKFIKAPILNDKDQVIKYLHWGEEFEETPTEQQELDVEGLGSPILVCGHHGHCPQPIQFVDSTLVAFSLGDFISNYDLNAPENGMYIRVEFSKNVEWSVQRSHWEFISQKKSVVSICQ